MLNTLPIQEAKDSSEIENIVTTSDALYKADVEKEKKIDQTTKEVMRYTIALNEGFDRIKEDGILRTNDIISIQKALDNLKQYINNDALSAVHPLIKMAIIHVQFESIHPFYDGNGRTGRIIKMLYLVQKGMLEGVKQTSIGTIEDITQIRGEMMNTKHQIRSRFSFYSQDLINHIFRHPYTKINHLMKELKVSRPTATKYLDTLTDAGFLVK